MINDMGWNDLADMIRDTLLTWFYKIVNDAGECKNKGKVKHTIHVCIYDWWQTITNISSTNQLS